MSSCKKTPTIQGTLLALGDEIPGADNTDPPKQGGCFKEKLLFQALLLHPQPGFVGRSRQRGKWPPHHTPRVSGLTGTMFPRRN